MIVLDVSLLIAHLDAGDPHHERATAFLLHLAAAEATQAAIATFNHQLAAAARSFGFDVPAL